MLILVCRSLPCFTMNSNEISASSRNTKDAPKTMSSNGSGAVDDVSPCHLAATAVVSTARGGVRETSRGHKAIRVFLDHHGG